MKKPKKSTAAKPRSPRPPSNGTKLRAKAAAADSATEAKKPLASQPKKARAAEPKKTPAAEPKKTPVKRVRKNGGISATPEPPRPIEVPAPPVPVAKAKEPETKPPAKPQTVEAAPKPASGAGLVAESKSVSEKPTVLEAKRGSRPAREAPSRIPTILLEGDKPSAPQVSGPGERYALGPSAPVEKLQTEGELPTCYGTGEILLTARDPHWLYTHWDLSDDQQRRYNASSRDGHLIVRVHIDSVAGKPVAEVHVHPESRHWFIHVAQANTRYVAQLGYYSAADKWTPIATSSATLTPPDAISPETTAEFATIPFEVPMQKLLSLVKEAVQESAPLAQALEELRVEGHPQLPQLPPPQPAPPAPRQSHAPAKPTAVTNGKASRRAPWKPSAWTPAQERALAEVISMDHVRRVWMGSLEITELIRRQVLHEFPQAAAGELGEVFPGAPTSPAGPLAGAVTGISSPGARAEQLQPPGKGFWFNVNAELIVYGATEPDATVTIGGRKIKLRPDGSFSYRFALPDGNYEMPVVAISADQTDGRAAEMKFSRSTEYRGHVGAHPQDPSLRQLLLENF